MAQKKDKIFTDILYPGFTDCRYIGAAFRASDFRKGFTGMFFIFLIDWPMGGSFSAQDRLQLFFPGAETEKVSGEAMQTYFLAGTIHQLQIIAGLTVTFILGLVFADLKFGFGILPVLGFYGGHSMAIAGGTIFDEAGYMASGAQVGATFATIGLLTGVICGMFEINRAAQKGITKVKMKGRKCRKAC